MSFLEEQLTHPVRFAKIRRAFYVGLVIVVLAECLVLLAQVVLPDTFHGEHHFWFENIPAFGSLYGLLSCVAIIVGSKFVGKAWLMRREDYYDS